MKRYTVLSVGYTKFVFDNPKDAAKVLELLSGAVEVESTHRTRKGHFTKLFYPTERARELSLTQIMSDQVLRCKPPGEADEAEVITETNLLPERT